MSESRCNYQRTSLTNPQKQWFVSSHFASNRSFKSLFFNKPDLVLIKCNLFIYNLHERHSYWLLRLNYLFAFVDQRGLHSHIVFDKILWQTSGLVNFRNSLVRKQNGLIWGSFPWSISKKECFLLQGYQVISNNLKHCKRRNGLLNKNKKPFKQKLKYSS